MSSVTSAASVPAEMAGDPLFSLVVATVGRSDELRPLVRSLLAQHERRFELLVVDQNSDDRVDAVVAPLRAAGLTVQHLRLATRNSSLARNAGLQQARARWVAFPDDDCWYDPDTLARAVARLDLPDAPDALIGLWVELDAPAPRLDLGAWRQFRGGAASMIVQFMSTQAVRRWGGFDERLALGSWYGGGEETDLLMRALQLGARWVHEPGVRVHHACGERRPISWQAQLQRSRGTGALYVKHGLSAWVALRGLLAPLVLVALRHRDALPWRQALAMSVGRGQGLIGWRLGRHQASR